MKNVMIDPEKVARALKTATEVFGRQGFIKNKTDQIISQAQVFRGLPSHYFDNKQVLYPDAFRYAYHRIYDHMDPKKWQNAPGLAAMIAAAAKYELELQFKFPIEYRLMMQTYVDLPHFLEPLQQQVQQEITTISAETDRIFHEKIE